MKVDDDYDTDNSDRVVRLDSNIKCDVKMHGDNLNTTQTPECTKEKYNAKIKVKGSLLRSHQQPM
jgi:hypothetical protein